MFKRRKSTEEEPLILDEAKSRQKTFDRAVNLLAFKARSIKELRERLLEKNWTNALIVEEVIEKLTSYGYLNDETFAKNLAASKLREKPMGKRLLQQKLALKKLDKETVAAAMEQAFEETPEDELIDRAIQKRLRLKGKPTTREDSKKFYDYLLRQGFSFDLVGNKMREIAKMDDGEEFFRVIKIKYDNRRFRSVSNSESGEVSSETVFAYKHVGDVVHAEYSGGQVVFGTLIAKVVENGCLEMRYQHLNSQGELMTGKCFSTPELLRDGKLRLHEKWQWTCGEFSEGESVIEEI